MNHSFAAPLVAAIALAAAIAVPLMVHLLFRQRERIVEWAAMRFLPIAKRKRNRRIDHWPLFLARVFALLLPLLAMFAVLPGAERLWQSIRPGPLETTANAPRTHTILVLDATLSMTATNDGETLFDAAKRKAIDAIQSANPGDGFSLIVLEGTASVKVPGPSNNLDAVLDEVKSASPFHGPTDLAAGMNAVADLLSRSPPAYLRRRVLILTDRQRTEWSGMLPTSERPLLEIWGKLTARADVAVVDVGHDGLENLALAGLTLADPLPLVDDPVLVTATVRNASRQDRRQVRVELSLGRPGGSPVPLEVKAIESIPAGGQASVSFLLDGASRFRTPGPHVLQARLAEPDALITDDLRSLAFELRDGLNVLLVNGRPAGSPLRRASEFFSEALAPGGRISPGNPFRPRTISVEEFTDASLSDLAAVDCVVLCDLPTITPSQIARLESLLKRGGGVIIGLGPNAAANRELYNRLLGPAGSGFLPGNITDIASGNIHFTATDAAFRLPPLVAFQEANARAGLTGVPFQSYWKLAIPPESAGRRILSFAAENAAAEEKPDAALVEVPKHRGRILTFTSTLNREWTDWPILPSFLPFAHELVRFAAGNGDPWTLAVGEPIEDFYPATAVGQIATLTRPDGSRETATVGPAETGGVVRFRETNLAGLYQLSVPGQATHPIAVNVPGTAAGLGESDLRRLDAGELAPLGLQVVTDPNEVKTTSGEEGTAIVSPRPQGPVVARWLALAGLILLAIELLLAWRLGPSRSAISGDFAASSSNLLDKLLRILGWLFVIALLGFFAAIVPATFFGHWPAFVPDSLRSAFERWLDVPAAGPGEGTRWRFASSPLFAKNARTDHIVLASIIGVLILGAALLYRKERRATGRGSTLILPFALRASAYALIGLVVLPQLRLVFEREGFPEIVVLVDTSASMSTVDEDQPNGGQTRLGRVQNLLLKENGEWLARLQRDRRVKAHIYSLADQTSLAATIDGPPDLAAARTAVEALKPTGPSSRLGDGVEAVLKAHRGGSLAAIVIFSDGITTNGPDLPVAGRAAARAGVPLFTVGVGDRREPLDLAIADTRLDDVIAKGDELIVEARLLSRGAVTGPVTVTLFEKRGDAKIALDHVTLTPDAGGKPIPFKLRHRPAEAGEKTYVIEVPVLPGELDAANNSVERTVLVTEGRKLRVLYIEGRPRYEFRFLKTLLEREVETAGERSVDFHSLLLDAGKDYATTDRSALRAFPSKAELFEYDVVILGDVDPQSLPHGVANLLDLAEFVRIRGGGLLAIAGEQAMPRKYVDTPFADLLPVLPSADVPPDTTEDRPLTEGYHLQLTPLGRQHPLLRLSSDDAENVALWQRLTPLLWSSTGYTRRQIAEVLAVHPALGVEGAPGENHPLILQQFAGAGRVMFFGFDESWRWRLRRDEELFNRFWRQAIRVLARNRVSRVELRTEKPGPYRRDEPIVLTVRFPDDAPPPSGPVKVNVERTSSGDRQSEALVLAKIEGSRASYRATLARTPEGVYRFRLVEPLDFAKSSTLEVSVLPPPGEMDRLELNAADLSRAAGESGGKYYPIDGSDSLLDDLPDGTRPPLDQPCPPLPLWNLPLTFAAILSLLGIEWVLRKRGRLL